MFRLLFICALPVLAGCFNHVVISPFGGGPEETDLREYVVQGRPTSSCFASYSSRPKIAVIPVQGIIGAETFLRRDGTSVAATKRMLDLAAGDADVAALLLMIDSPGGTVTASDQINKLIKDFTTRTKKPVFAHVDGLGASGAYYIAVASSEINAAPTSMIGSIGVILQNFSIRGLMEKLGVEYRSLKTGKNKDSLSPFRELRDDEREFFMRQLNQAYEVFLARILEGRKGKIAEDALRQLADGSVYSAVDAKEHGLVDSVSYIEEYTAQVEKQLNISDALFVAYLPPGRSYSLYNLQGQRTSIMSLFELPNHPTAQMYYLWDGAQ